MLKEIALHKRLQKLFWQHWDPATWQVAIQKSNIKKLKCSLGCLCSMFKAHINVCTKLFWQHWGPATWPMSEIFQKNIKYYFCYLITIYAPTPSMLEEIGLPQLFAKLFWQHWGPATLPIAQTFHLKNRKSVFFVSFNVIYAIPK